MNMPNSIPFLPPKCLLICFDAEGCTQDFIPGSTMSIGAYASLWHPTEDPVDNAILRNRILRFFCACTPTVPMDEKTAAFWARNPRAKAWSTTDTIPIKFAFSSLADWVLRLWYKCDFPVVMAAQPLAYDLQHLIHGMQATDTHYNFPLMKGISFADCAELYSNHHNLDPVPGKTEFKANFMPKQLLHHPTLDSLAQLNALLAGLFHQRGTIPA